MSADFRPEVDWANSGQWDKVYAPSSDTFFLCDGIVTLKDRFPPFSTVLEIGSGSGYVTAFTSHYLHSIGKTSVHFATDINLDCCFQTRHLCESNGALVSPLRDCFATSIRGPIDVAIFNPPYVETDGRELQIAQNERGIAASWAGGDNGAVVIYDFLRFIVANRDTFAADFFVILLISVVNRPKRLRKFCDSHGLGFRVILERNCQGESLKICEISGEVL
jgi:release factor glutamine methyltransferase